jgi:GxxExxY protein
MDGIVECIKTVSNELGSHYKENIYQSALYLEMNLKGYITQTEVVVPIIYKGYYLGFERADIVVYSSEGEITNILELKSQNSRITAKEIIQLRKYLKNLNCESGVLVNFFETLEIYTVTQETSRKV